MAEEPRRSNRATKGQHTKKDDSPETQPAPPSGKVKKIPNKKSHSQRKKKGEEEEEEEEVEDEEDEDFPIRCICGATEDDGAPEENWIGCDNCEAWQHCDCMRISKNSKKQPDKYLCEQCGPAEHPELMAALEAGEALEEVAARRRAEYKKHGESLFPQPRKGGRKSAGAVKDVSAPATPASTEPSKSKTPSETPRPQVPATKRKSSTHLPAADIKRRKSEQLKAESADVDHAMVEKITFLPGQREKSAVALRNVFTPLIADLTSDGSFVLPKGASADSFAEQLAIKVEYAMFMNHCDLKKPDYGGGYKDAFLRIQPNVKRNRALFLELLNGDVSPDTLSTMTADEMASEEQRQKDAALKQRMEKQHILSGQEEAPRVRRTHKGDEVVENQANQITSESVSVMAPPGPRRRESEMDMDSPTAEQKPPIDDKEALDTSAKSPQEGMGRRRSSSNFNINRVWQDVVAGGSPAGQSAPRPMQQPPRRYSSNGPYIKTNAEDEDIDRLLDDGATESAPYSPTDFDGGRQGWKGKVGMAGPPHFTATAQHIAGGDLSQQPGGLWRIFPRELEIGGRIPSKDAIDYVTSLHMASNTDVSVFNLVPNYDDNTVMRHFDQLFDYFQSRRRWGVIPERLRKEYVRDVYIFPVEAGDSPLPSFMSMLGYNALEGQVNRERRLICAIFVIRYKDQGAQSATPAAAAGGSLLSPVNQTPGSAMSPMAPTFPDVSGRVGQGATTAYPPPGAAGQQLPVMLNGATHHQQSGQSAGLGNSYQSPQTPTPQGYPPEKAALINEVLGPYASVRTAVTLLALAGDIQLAQLQGLRKLYEEDPDSRDDMQRLQAMLARQDMAHRPG